MFVKLMTSDRWENRRDFPTEVADPDWAQVLAAIDALDGKVKTMVTLAPGKNAESYLMISGQWDDRFMVNVTPDNYDFFSLVDPSRSDRPVSLTVGGQEGEYEENKCVPREWMLKAARRYLETGEMDSSLNWVSDY